MALIGFQGRGIAMWSRFVNGLLFKTSPSWGGSFVMIVVRFKLKCVVFVF